MGFWVFLAVSFVLWWLLLGRYGSRSIWPGAIAMSIYASFERQHAPFLMASAFAMLPIFLVGGIRAIRNRA